jgi:hypothetical protein
MNAIIAMKTRGSTKDIPGYEGDFHSTDSYEYSAQMLKGLGYKDDEIPYYLGPAKGNTEMSYYALMELMAKKRFQDQNFYVGLYDNPENGARQHVAMQSLGLSLDREMFESRSRSSMLMALVLEAKVQKMQETVDSTVGGIRER